MAFLLARDTGSTATDEVAAARPMNPRDEQPDIAERLRAQDAQAFRCLVNEQQALVLSLCQTLGLRGADIDEAATDVFAQVYQSLSGFDGRSAVRTWVYRIACRTIVRYRQRLRRHHLGEFDPQMADPAHAAPEAPLVRRETQAAVWEAVAELEPRQAQCMELCYRQGWPLEQIADTLGCPVGTVKTLLFRARARLRQRLSEQGITP